MKKVEKHHTTRDVNDTSLVLRFDYGEHSALFPGDLYVRGEAWVLENIDITKLDVDLLKIPHHARSTSSSETFVNAVTPEIAVGTGQVELQVGDVYEAVNATTLIERDRGYIHVSANADGGMSYKTSK